MIVWREKLIATAIHFAATLLVAAIAAGVIFLVWYPPPFAEMIGGGELFLLVVGCDLALGPLLSLVVYNSRKSRRELWLDYTVIGVVQISALVYGVMTTADARPAYVAFSQDRFEIVLAGDLRDSELDAARDPRYREVRWTGPELIAVFVPPEDQQDALFQALSGNEAHRRPRFFVPLESRLDSLRERSKPLATLKEKEPAAKPLLQAALRDVQVPRERLEWLPVSHFRGFWTAVIDETSGIPVAYVDLDPYD